MRIILCKLLIVLTLCVILASCSDDTHQTDGVSVPVKIGFLGPLSGEDESWGKDILNGCRFVLEEAQSSGKFRFVELVTADDGNSPEKAEEAFTVLAEQENLFAILAASDSRTVLKLKERADMYKIPVLSLSATHPKVTDSGFISQLLFDDIVQGTVAALYVHDEMLVDSAAVLKNSANPHSDMLASTFARKFSQAGGEVEVVDRVKTGTSIEERLSNFIEDQVPFLYLPLEADEVIQTVKTLKKMDYEPQLMVSDGLLGVIYDRFKKSIDDLEGMLAIDAGSTGLDLSPIGKKLIQDYKEQGSERGTTFTLAGAEGMMIMLHALSRCSGDENPQCLNAMLRSTKDFQGIYGKLTIMNDGKAERPIYISQIKRGRMNVVVKVY